MSAEVLKGEEDRYACRVVEETSSSDLRFREESSDAWKKHHWFFSMGGVPKS